MVCRKHIRSIFMYLRTHVQIHHTQTHTRRHTHTHLLKYICTTEPNGKSIATSLCPAAPPQGLFVSCVCRLCGLYVAVCFCAYTIQPHATLFTLALTLYTYIKTNTTLVSKLYTWTTKSTIPSNKSHPRPHPPLPPLSSLSPR